jgi:aspartate kinase
MLTVEKIGGTSMSALGEVLNNIILYKRKGSALYNRIFVVSAFAGVTDLLLENKKTGEPGVYHHFTKQKDFHKSLKVITGKLQELNKKYEALGLDVAEADRFIESRIELANKFLDNLAIILASGYVSHESILQAAREILASVGEAHSAFNLSNILNTKGIHSTFIDLCGFDDKKTYTIDQRINHAFKGVDFSKTICIATGYTKGTEGIMREFDRGYSEVTFSKVTIAVKAHEAIIHKEYHLSSADPNIVGKENCIPVGFTNYDVADQLADVGMEAIHPKASKPLEINGVNLRIKNTFEPEHPGTLISENYTSKEKRVEVITGTDKIVIIDIYDPLMVGNVGTDLQIMQEFASFDVSYIFKATSANSISIAIWEKDFDKKLISKLKSSFESVTVEEVALVCMIGSNIDQPGVLSNAAGALARQGINIKAGGFALRKINIQFVVSRKDYKEAIRVLNSTMFFA